MSLSRKSGFTLIELLVVITIIAILAAILFPVFAQAREKARQTACLSNEKQIGTAITMYVQDYDETYPQAYWYKDDAGEPGGYFQWSGAIMPYTKNADLFVCPSDPNRGLPPTSAKGQAGPQYDTAYSTTINGLDSQVPRLSYTVNAAIMPRKRRSNADDAANVVPIAALQAPADEILVAEFSNYASCVNDNSANQTNTNPANKSHRPTNAVMTSASGGKYAGQSLAERDMPQVYGVTPAILKAEIDACKVAPNTTGIHMKYMEPARHSGGSNYIFADSHAKFFRVEQTLKCDNWKWGKTFYGMGNKPIICADTTSALNGQPVQ